MISIYDWNWGAIVGIICIGLIMGVIIFLIISINQMSPYTLKSCQTIHNGTTYCYYYNYRNSSDIKVLKPVTSTIASSIESS